MESGLQHTLPDPRFGMTRTRYNVPAMPDVLPSPEEMRKANLLNEYRYRVLTYQQRLFLDSYFANDFDTTKAALDAGYSRDEKEAAKIGKKLARKPYMVTAISLALDYHAEKSSLKIADVINEIRNIAFANMGDYMRTDGDGGAVVSLPEDRSKLAALQEVTCETYMDGRGEDAREVKRVKFKLYNKLDALEKLLKILNVGQGAAAKGEESKGATTVNVQTVNIIAVPTGTFLPAPTPAPQIIENEQKLLVSAG